MSFIYNSFFALTDYYEGEKVRVVVYTIISASSWKKTRNMYLENPRCRLCVLPRMVALVGSHPIERIEFRAGCCYWSKFRGRYMCTYAHLRWSTRNLRGSQRTHSPQCIRKHRDTTQEPCWDICASNSQRQSPRHPSPHPPNAIVCCVVLYYSIRRSFQNLPSFPLSLSLYTCHPYLVLSLL